MDAYFKQGTRLIDAKARIQSIQRGTRKISSDSAVKTRALLNQSEKSRPSDDETRTDKH